MTAAGSPAAGPALSIGAVLARLKPDFPEVSISKIRFLESEGLVEPQRSPGGYRQFLPADVERLRYVLAAQRDHYLPLRVIKEQLDAIERGLEPGTPSPRLPRSVMPADGPTPADFAGPARPADVRMTRVELLAECGLSSEQLRELESYGLVSAMAGGWYDVDNAAIAKIAAELIAAGLEPRHLRPMRTAAERESSLISQLVSAQARQRDPDAKERAGALAAQLAATMLQVHSLLVKTDLRKHLGG
ncbi:MerR family transcriptional regulator [Nakamurella aerolata]|uniref:MerR family transcriptional regulator n=1 Tax=Nakamurella aerolata TaxID=1656892 RepID=A0A849A936_9ACTN|nr:MerR family transcriptional regulator [Nakamurella aerolata]NNG36126.1 MerR family transcriptional regulator [Nakamurella aerolata]